MRVHDTVGREAADPPAVVEHEPWCDLHQHALAAAEAVGPTGCVGRYVAQGDVGGWIAEDAAAPGGGSRFVLDWQPAEGWNSLRPEEAAQLSALLARLLDEQRLPA